MKPDVIEMTLEAVEEGEYTRQRSLHLHTYLQSSDHINENTVIFDADPVGSNYSRSYLEVEFEDISSLKRISEFLANHIAGGTNMRRTLDIPVKRGKSIIREGTGESYEKSGIDEITLDAEYDYIRFRGGPTPAPTIRSFERSKEGEPQDKKNATHLIEYFEEVSGEESADRTVSGLHDADLLEDCVRKYEQGDFAGAVRDGCIVLEERVNSISPSELNDLDGADLMKQAFSADSGPIRLAEDTGTQEGLMMLFAGTYQAIRNPIAHQSPEPNGDRFVDTIDEAQAKNILHLLDYLLLTLDRGFEDQESD